MADSLTTKTVEGASGAQFSLRFVDNGSSQLTPAAFLLATELGGYSTYSALATGSSDDATVVKASAGQLYGYSFFSIQTAPLYLKFYDKATSPAVATDTPKLRIGLLEEVTAGSGSHRIEMFPHGIPFDTGISFVLVTGITDTDGTDVTADQSIVNVYYK